jgi:hypothetical protein
MKTPRRSPLTFLALTLLLPSALALATPAKAQWGYWGPGYGGYGGYGSYGYGGEGCGNLNCEGDGWDGGYADMKDKEKAAAGQDQFDKEFGPAKPGKLCKSKTPTYNDWGDFTGYKPVMIPCNKS